METNNIYDFKLKKQDLSEVRYIKLGKKASYSEKWNEIKGNQDNLSIKFYSFGFYDLLTCFKASNYINYKEHFHISQSFNEYRNTLKVEQWFGIFPVDKGSISTEMDSAITDPFFCDDSLSHELPFLGVVLISLSNSKENESQEKSFKENLGKFVSQIKLKITERNTGGENIRFISKLYYSLNCADLCLVIRTDSLDYIHRLNREIGEIAKNSKTEINTTVIFSVLHDVSVDDLEKLDSKNAEVSFVVRSNERYDDNSRRTEKKDADKVSEETNSYGTSYGVNGTGKFVTKLSYQQYRECLSELIKYKLGDANSNEIISPFVQSVCHEREWFKEQSSVDAIKSDPQIPQENICRWINNVREKIISIEGLANTIFTFSKGKYVYRKMFQREFHLIEDLVDTYSDLWYKNVSQSGYIFFAQIWIALIGIEEMLNKIQDIEDSFILEQSVQSLYETVHAIACDLNGYNKQFQYLNQDSVNFPSYEIQSKVNSEKYMAAYSSFLHQFFAVYYQNKKQKEFTVQSFPLALIDITQRKIVTNIFFSSLYKENKKEDNSKKRRLFSVHFPSVEYFSDMWNSIPLLMHEIFHILHYGKAKYRNKAIVSNIDRYFTEKIVTRLLDIVNEGVTISNSSILAEILRKSVYRAIVRERTEFFKDVPEYYISGRFDQWRFREVKDACTSFYSRIFDCSDNTRDVSYMQTFVLQNKIKKDVEYVLQCVGFTEICCAFVTDVDVIPTELYYAANALYLFFDPHMYEVYHDKYDFFFEMLRRDIDEEKEGKSKSILGFIAYKCKRFDKQNKLPEIKKENLQDDLYNWYGLIWIIFVAGMISIFEKYQTKICDRKQKRKFERYCKDLMPRPNYGNVADYSEKLKEVYQNSGLIGQDKRVLKNMFYEYFELYCSCNNLVRFLSDEKSSEIGRREDDTGKFIKVLHKKCQKYIQKLITMDKSQCFEVAITRTNREQLVKLGLIDEEEYIFKKVFSVLLSEVDDDFVKDLIADRTSLFQEVYADCGMCSSIGFDFFGYCMFSLSNHNTVNDFTATGEKANFLADRIRAIAGMFFGPYDRKDLEEAKTFLSKLFDREMIESIIKMMDSIKQSEELSELSNLLSEAGNIPDFMSLQRTREVFLSVTKPVLSRWEDDVICKLIAMIESIEEDGQSEKEEQQMTRQKLALAKNYLFNLYNVLEIFYKEDIFSKLATERDPFGYYFYQLKDKILCDDNREIGFVNTEECIIEIRRFYNLESPEKDKFDWYYKLFCNGFLEQSNFIFEYYCKYKDAYYKIIKKAENEEDLKIEDWYDIIDDYYIKKEI